jgi:hypothetical protein
MSPTSTRGVPRSSGPGQYECGGGKAKDHGASTDLCTAVLAAVIASSTLRVKSAPK